jgi:hypothetical protein
VYADSLRHSASEGSESDEERVIRRGESARDTEMRANAFFVADLMSAAKREASRERGTEGENDRGISALVQEEFISTLSCYTTCQRERVRERVGEAGVCMCVHVFVCVCVCVYVRLYL